MNQNETPKVNQHQPDPITNRVMADSCWNGEHQPKCAGWLPNCPACSAQAGKPSHRKAECTCERCQCACHDDISRPRRVKRDNNLTMHILDSGCGTIEVK